MCIYDEDVYFLKWSAGIWRRNSPCNMDQIYLVKYSVTKRLGEKTTQKSHNVELQVTNPGVNILVSHLWAVLLLDVLASLVGVNLFQPWCHHHLGFHCGATCYFYVLQPSNDERQKEQRSKESKGFAVGCPETVSPGRPLIHFLSLDPCLILCSLLWSGTFQPSERERTHSLCIAPLSRHLLLFGSVGLSTPPADPGWLARI